MAASRRCLNVPCAQCENGKPISLIDSAQPTMPHGGYRLGSSTSTRRQYPSARHATPARLLCSAARRRSLLRGCYSGELRAGASPAMLWCTRVLVTRSEATMERWMEGARTTRGSKRSGPAEDRAQPAEGRSRRTGGWIRADDVYPEYGGALTYRMQAETLRVRAGIACVFYACICTVTTARKWINSFRSIRFQSYAVESQVRKANKRIGNVSCRIQL
jgi:hypothetical protein